MKKLLSNLFPFTIAEAIFFAAIAVVVFISTDDKPLAIVGTAVTYFVIVIAHISGVDFGHRLTRTK